MTAIVTFAFTKIFLFVAAINPQGQAACTEAKNNTFFGLPVWYKYLPYEWVESVQDCRINIDIKEKPEQLALIGFAAIDILLRVAGIAAVAFVIYGGIQYILSQGEPDGVSRAKNTIVNALIGLAIALIASSLVAFVGKTIG